MCGSAVKPSCDTMREDGSPSVQAPSSDNQAMAFGERAESSPTLLTYRNSNSALTHKSPRPGKILQDI